MEAEVKSVVDNYRVIDLQSEFSYDLSKFYGIDNLLTTNKMIREFASTHNTDVDIYKLDKVEQAEIIWDELFVKRTPISDNCIEIISIMKNIGLEKLMFDFDLNGIRKYFGVNGINSSNIIEYIDKIFDLSGVNYTITSNKIFDKNEIIYLENRFTPKKNDIVLYKKNNITEKVKITHCHCLQGYPLNYNIIFDNGREKNTLWNYLFMCDEQFNKITKRFKNSLNIDILLREYNKCLNNGLIKKYGFNENTHGVRDYLLYWCHSLRPEFFTMTLENETCYDFLNIDKDWVGSVSQILNTIIIPLSIELSIPISIKIENTTFIDDCDKYNLNNLYKLCKSFPKCKFMAYFLYEVNYNKLFLLSRELSNLHINGCFLNNLKLTEENTKNMINVFNLNCSFNYSGSTVLEHFIYKWKQYKKIIIDILIDKYKKLELLGLKISKKNIERDVDDLFNHYYLDKNK